MLDNASPKLALQALGLMALGARETGWNLLANQLGRSYKRRQSAYAAHGKPVFSLPTVNCEAALALVREQRIDLIVNARTRFIYKQPILAAPPLGCLNVHHGLLPEQRGTMCDLWVARGSPRGGVSRCTR